MDRYTVVWAPGVQDGLLERWLAADRIERERLTRASHTIDRELASDPQFVGRVMPAVPTLRVWDLHGFNPRVTVIFGINAGDRIVQVHRVTIVVQ